LESDEAWLTKLNFELKHFEQQLGPLASALACHFPEYYRSQQGDLVYFKLTYLEAMLRDLRSLLATFAESEVFEI